MISCSGCTKKVLDFSHKDLGFWVVNRRWFVVCPYDAPQNDSEKVSHVTPQCIRSSPRLVWYVQNMSSMDAYHDLLCSTMPVLFRLSSFRSVFYFWHENAINASPQLSKPNYLQEKYSDNRIGLGARIIFRRPIAVRYLKINSTVSGLAHDRKPFFSCQMDDSYVVSSNWYTNPSSWTDSTRMAERCQIASQLIGSLCNGIYDVEPEVILNLCTNSNRSCSWSNLKNCALWVSKEGRWSKFTST